ncbi:glycosyl hydrolase family 18 protein [Paenibacillus hexagrammi]|uniref:Glycosyl hydrolase family 18 protein n=1 Tax=Paenibacillus hexagrammi TaxID=2908839 RepID=A0ABY3SEM9_9BACL|nr:glycosyl hydrolase family 18 protein [Paenibacillus sp. YPD9-1]UJF32444.1 glycosyl hydrolase family 18 protein [Paenibacillus sp. YPD9-1]
MYPPLTEPRARRKKKSIGRIIFLLFIVLLILASGIVYFFFRYLAPNKQHVATDFHDLSKPVFYQGKYFKTSAIGEKDAIKLPLELIQEWIDPTIVFEKSSDSVIITTKDKVLRFKTSELSAFMNEKPYTLSFPVEKKDQEIYVPIDPLQELYHIEIRESDASGAVMLFKQGDHVQWGKMNAQDKTQLRTGASVKMPIVSEAAPDEQVIILGEENGWLQVQQKTGPIGYVKKGAVTLDHEETIPVQKGEEAQFAPKPPEGKLNVTWEHVISKNPDTSKISDMPGLNVISPTWFSLANDTGKVSNSADSAYVKWAHARNYQVWALFSNGFEPDRTSKALSTYDLRMKMIKQLLGFAKTYDLQGFNIDFENVYVKDKENLVQFVREMTPLMHEQGLAVSIDVTPKSSNEMWSVFYDRPALGEVVDYMMLMAYDEYWATSPKSGSVSSLPWAEKSLVQLLDVEKVPSSKVVLGMPFYTRQWTEQTKNGKTVVRSKTLSMEQAQSIIKEKKADTCLFAGCGAELCGIQRWG